MEGETESNESARQQAAELTRATLNATVELGSTGWTRMDSLPTFTLVLNIEDGDGERIGAAVEATRPLLSAAQLTWRRGTDFLTLAIAESGNRPLLRTDSSHGTLQATFSNEEIADAEAAFDGDTAAALRLVGEWRASLNIDPARCLASADPNRHWLVVPDPPAVTALLTERPWWELKALVQPGRPVVVAVHRSGAELDIRTACQRICALERVAIDDAKAVASPQHDFSQHLRSVAEGIAAPSALHPLSWAGTDADVNSVLSALRRQTSATCWALLATAIDLQSSEARAEFFGLQRASWPLQALGPDLTPSQHDAVYRLWLACSDNPTPDRLLATRQVVSLYRSEPWAYADDIYDASEPLFLALRSTATAEALQAQREARALALSVARQTAASTTGLAKNATERALAVFAGVGGIIIAKTSKTISASQATDLRHLLGVYLFILAIWSFFLEGPPVTSAIDGLSSDLTVFSDLLTESEQESILGSSTVRQAKRQAWGARIIVPVAYVAVGLVALKLGG